MKYKQIPFLFTFYIIFFSSQVFAQKKKLPKVKIMGIDFTTIADLVNDEESVYYYPNLLEKYNKLDSSLYRIDYIMLYYGHALQNEYNPFKDMLIEDSLSRLNSQGKFAEVNALSNKFLQKKPISFFGNIERGACLYALEDSIRSVHFLEKYNRLFTAVETAGMGSSYEDPIVLISPMDAEVFLKRYQLKIIEKKAEDKNKHKYLYFKVLSPEEREFPIYFDVTIPFAFLENKKNND